MPSLSSAALVARHRALPAGLLGLLTRHRVLSARPRPRLLGALPSPHVAARCRILDCMPDRSAASLQPWPRLLGVLHPLHVATLYCVPDCPLLGAWGLGSAAGTGALLHIWLIVATGAPVRREGCH